MFFSKGTSINELKNNYIVSRMLVKIFTEMNLYYTLLSIQQDYNKYKETDIIVDNTIKEFYDYSRYGKPNKIYNYESLKRSQLHHILLIILYQVLNLY